MPPPNVSSFLGFLQFLSSLQMFFLYHPSIAWGSTSAPLVISWTPFRTLTSSKKSARFNIFSLYRENNQLEQVFFALLAVPAAESKQKLCILAQMVFITDNM